MHNFAMYCTPLLTYACEQKSSPASLRQNRTNEIPTCKTNETTRWNKVAFFQIHDDVIKWKHFPRYWPFVRGIHRSPVNSPHKGQWRGALMFSLICVWINGWVNNRAAGDLRRYRAHYDVTVMPWTFLIPYWYRKLHHTRWWIKLLQICITVTS